jgi:hypothetical protein
MDLIIGTIAIVAVLVVLAAVRISQMASWRAVATIAAATHSPRACLEFIRYCERM